MVELSCLLACEELVDLSDESGELRNELYDTLRDDSNTEVVTVSCSLLNRVSNLVCDVSKRHLLSCNFLTDEADVRLCLKSTLESNVGSAASHNLDEMPILLCRVGISLDVADELGICLCSCIETERSLDVLVLKVTVDRLGAADNLDACVVCSHVLSECCSVCVGVVTADDDDSCEAVLLSEAGNSLELLNCLELCSAGTDDIESACVPVCVDELIVELYIIILKKGPPLNPRRTFSGFVALSAS